MNQIRLQRNNSYDDSNSSSSSTPRSSSSTPTQQPSSTLRSSSSSSSTSQSQNTQFKFKSTFNNITTILSFFSPYILITFFTMLSFYFGTYQGIMYFGFTLFSIGIRYLIYKYNTNNDTENKSEDICNIIEYFGSKMPSFISMWMFCHTLGYILVPILLSIVNTNFNTVRIFNSCILIVLFSYLMLDIYVKNKIGQCFKNKPTHLLINAGASFLISLIFSLSRTFSGNETAKSLIYFNDMTSYTGTSVTSHCARVTPTKFQCTA